MPGSDVRNELHTLTVDNITGTQILSAGGKVYFSLDSMDSQLDIQEIVETYAKVKAPTYGEVIPQSITIVSKAGGTGIVTIFTPESNKIYQILAAGGQNSGDTNPIEVQMGLYNGSKFIPLGTAAIDPTGYGGVTDIKGIRFSSDVYPAFRIKSGTAGDLEFNLAYGVVVQ